MTGIELDRAGRIHAGGGMPVALQRGRVAGSPSSVELTPQALRVARTAAHASRRTAAVAYRSAGSGARHLVRTAPMTLGTWGATWSMGTGFARAIAPRTSSIVRPSNGRRPV